MGEWSEYFEDFPEENPANYVDGRYAPEEAKAIREQESRNLQKKVKAFSEMKRRSLFLEIVQCVQCGETQLSIYKYRGGFFICECEKCGIYGKGKTQQEAINKANYLRLGRPI